MFKSTALSIYHFQQNLKMIISEGGKGDAIFVVSVVVPIVVVLLDELIDDIGNFWFQK